jgi:prolyl oligopeptidase
MPLKAILISAFLLAFHAAFSQSEPMKYPPTRKDEVNDVYFGTRVSDPYRWLEDDRSAETADWVSRQNKLTFSYLAQIPYREKIKSRLRDLWDFPRHSAPFKKGKWFFFYKNEGSQNHNVLYYQESLESEPKVLLDPNSLSADGTVSLYGISFSKDAGYFAYSLSRAGSDWNEIYVKPTRGDQKLGDVIKWVKFSSIAFKDRGFFYSAYPAPEEGKELSGKNQNHRVFYHRIGDKQIKDQLVYEDPSHPLRTVSASVTDDERFLIITSSESTSGNNLMVKDLSSPSSSFITIVPDFEHDYSVIGNSGSTLYILTNDDAPRYRLIAVNLEQPAKNAWRDVIPQSADLLETVDKAGQRFIAKYLKDVSSRISIFLETGAKISEVNLPFIGMVDNISAHDSLDFFFYSITSFTRPSEVYRYHFSNGNQDLFRKSKLSFNPDDFVTEQVFYPSTDGTKIPMFLIYKKGIVKDGNNPCFLYGYGGFNISVTPAFKVERMAFLEKGGIYAVANIRGGGEYGEDWHKAGTILNKQNVFNDFIAAAEFLIANAYTKSSKLAVHGRSNGGLLIGAMITQRPDLFQVAIPTVGVLDMLRYHKFTIGWAWATDYGTSQDSVQFFNLIKYSPLHNVRKNKYPAVMVTTADHDDRVVPAHSFKFISALQENQIGSLPTLIRIDVNAGHGAGKPVSMQIEEFGDIWAFVFYNLGMKF